MRVTLSGLAIALGGCAVQPTTPLVERTRTVAKVVRGDRSSRLYTFVHFRGASCDADPNFVVAVVSPPAHGRVTTGPGSTVPTEHTNGQHVACHERAPGVEVRYVPERGYRGPDPLTVSDGDSRVTFEIDVQPAAPADEAD